MRAEMPAPLPGRSSRLVVGILGVGGLALLALGIWLLIPALRSASWPSVQGVVTDHWVVSSRHQKSMNYEYDVGVVYVYEVERQRHTGRRFSHSTDTLPNGLL